MAWIETLDFTRYEITSMAGGVRRNPIRAGSRQYLPQLFWDDHRPWREANVWLLTRLEDGKKSATVASEARCLHAYAQWLESSGSDWLYFPVRKRDRCLVRYRGALICAMNDCTLRPSTAALRMRVAIRFYRWLRESDLLPTDASLWDETPFSITQFDELGFVRTVHGVTTELSIPNRASVGYGLEDGVLPLSEQQRNKILNHARTRCSPELFLILSLGFFTGMRLGTITDLRTETIFNAARDALTPEIHHLAIGPSASPPVHTKYGVTGNAIIPTSLLETLRDYCIARRRRSRQSKASPACSNLVFLTRRGNSYAAQRGLDRSSSLNVELHRLRRSMGAEQNNEDFRFHQTRATFATQLANAAVSKFGHIGAISIVQRALLHRNERTSERYIRFVEQNELKEYISNEYTRMLASTFASTASVK